VGSASRKPGSDRGRAVIDWELAFVFWAGLSPEQRCYQAVADKFAVSVRTVEKHGRADERKKRLAEINAQAIAQTNSSLGQARAEHVDKLRRLIDATLIGYAEKLRRGDMRMSPADLERLHKLWQQLVDELPAAGDANRADRPPPFSRSVEHTQAVIEALRESGALEALGLSTTNERNDDAEVG
jgi:hypothetical protein